MFIALGGSIGYWQGNVNYLVDDIGALKPSIFIGVPRVFDRIYNRVTDQVGAIERYLSAAVLCCNVLRVFDGIYNRVTDQVGAIERYHSAAVLCCNVPRVLGRIHNRVTDRVGPAGLGLAEPCH
jgi:hypothetical protein